MLAGERHGLRAALISFLRIEQLARFLGGHLAGNSLGLALIGAILRCVGAGCRLGLTVAGLGLIRARRWLLVG